MSDRKTYELQTVNHNNELIKKSSLTLEAGDKIVATIGFLDEEKTEPVPFEFAERFHEKISEALESDDKVLIVPYFIELQILKIE